MEHAQEDEERVYFELVFRPSTVLTSLVRRFITEFYERVVLNDDVTARLAMATHELLENAVKYGIPSAPATLCIEVDRTTGDLSVRTWNRSTEEHIAGLTHRFADMRCAADPFAYYQNLLRKSLHETTGSGLGLARIRCEGEMDLDVVVEGELVGIKAVAHLPEAAS